MLERVRERLAAASMLVTFNGKSFDMPLLRTRFAMARMEAPPSPPHLDLLHVARRMHGKRLGQGCRLVAIERDVLGFERVDDVRVGGRERVLPALPADGGRARAARGHRAQRVGRRRDGGAPRDLRRGRRRSSSAVEDLVGRGADAAQGRGARPGDRGREGGRGARGDARSRCARGPTSRRRAATGRAPWRTSSRSPPTVDDASVRLELAKLYEHWVRDPARALAWTLQGTGEDPERARRRGERLTRKADRVRQATLAGMSRRSR